MHPDFQWIGKSTDGQTITLRKFSGSFKTVSYATPEWLSQNTELVRTGVAIDVETTGLNKKTDTVIEVGLRQFKFNRANGDIVFAGEGYSAFQDPGKPLSDEIKRLTGLTDEMLRGQKIDWQKVDQTLQDASIIIAHNAAFDRPFIERSISMSLSKIWGCSLKQVDWQRKGFSVQKLEILSIYHGFFTDAHRALHDSDALLNLLSMNDWATQKTYLHELLQNAKRPVSRVVAANSPFESKDHLKERGYSWDTTNRVWHRLVYKDQLADEVTWMEALVYNGEFRGTIEEIALSDNFKS